MKCKTCKYYWADNKMCCRHPNWINNIGSNHWCGEYKKYKGNNK